MDLIRILSKWTGSTSTTVAVPLGHSKLLTVKPDLDLNHIVPDLLSIAVFKISAMNW
jgi:hypothetical protein